MQTPSRKSAGTAGKVGVAVGDPSLDRYRVMQQNENPASQAATPSARHNLSRGGGDAGATRRRSARSCTSRPWPELRACRRVHTQAKAGPPRGKEEWEQSGICLGLTLP